MRLLLPKGYNCKEIYKYIYDYEDENKSW